MVRDAPSACPTRHASIRAALAALLLVSACVPRAVSVSPGEIPSLQAQVEGNPSDGTALLRLSAALYADGRCEEALPVAERGRNARPTDPLGPLVVGQCLERAGRYEDALAEYAAYLSRSAGVRGAEAVRARERIARRAGATARARQALADEVNLGDVTADEPTIAVLPSVIAGDETYAPLSVGLSAMMASDLALLDRFRIVERAQIDALMSELRVGTSERVDAATAARVGRLVRANRMVQGIAEIPPSGDVRLEAAVVEAGGAVRSPLAGAGRLEELLRLEKQVVVGIAEQLGPPLTPAERTRILDNGTQNVIAFLAYSQGLEAEGRGDYGAAAAHYADAVRADPGFTQAREAGAYAAADAVVSAAPPEAITTVAADAEDAISNTRAGPAGGLGTTLSNAITDIASTQSERITDGIGDPTSTQQINNLTNVPSTGATPGVVPIQVLIRIPIPIPVR